MFPYAFLLLWSVFAPLWGQAQVLTPPITFNGPRQAIIRVTPAEAWMNVTLETQRILDAVPVIERGLGTRSKDSVLLASSRRAQAWVDALSTVPITGLQLDPAGRISVAALHDDLARRQVEERLAMPGLVLADRAYTLQMAVAGFASKDYPERLSVAEQYLRQLDALGDKAAFWQFNARKPLLDAYYRLGRSADVVRIGTRMFDLVDRIPFEFRGDQSMYNAGISFFYAAVVDALSGQPHGSMMLQAMNAKLMAATIPPPALVASDANFAYFSETYRSLMQEQVNMSARVGKPGTPLVANYWVNLGASHDSQTVAINDGKVHVLELGGYTCGPCMAAIPVLERLHRQYPDVAFTLLTEGMGTWGNRIVPPTVEAEHLAEHFVKNLKATFPIGIAMPTWVPRDDDGTQAVVTTPTWQPGHYPQTGKPTFYIIDRNGMIRRVIGGFPRDLEEMLTTIIDFLQKEGNRL